MRLIALAVATTLAVGCGKKSKKQDTAATVSVGGQLATTSYSLAGFSQAFKHLLSNPIFPAGTVKANKVLAMMIGKGGDLQPSAMKDLKSADVDASMKFQMEFSQSEGISWAMVLLDSTAASKADQVVGYVSMAEAGDSMVKMPVDKLEGNLELGQVSQNGDEARSEKSLSTTVDKFEINLEKLTEIAKTDDVIRNVKNIYANTSTDGTTYYNPQTTYQWGVAKATALNKDSDPTTYSEPTYNIIIFINDSASATFDQVCTASGGKKIEFVPPSTLTFPYNNETKTYTPTSPITFTGAAVDSGGSSCSGEHIYVGQGGGTFNFHPVSGQKVPLPVLTGQWKLKIDGVEKGSFDLATTSPLGSDGKPVVYVPIVKFNVDSSDVISSAEIKFSTWDKASGKYTTLTDLTTFESAVSQISVTCDDSDGDSGVRVMDFATGLDAKSSVNGIYTAKFGKTWKYSATNTASILACSWRVSYTMGGTQFNFGSSD